MFARSKTHQEHLQALLGRVQPIDDLVHLASSFVR
jgi:hypothetical protein